jgi:5'-methylthioadenosine phosphorylase
MYYITMDYTGGAMVGIIGGSGLSAIPGLRMEGERALVTPWGAPSAPYVLGTLGGVRIAFLSRHGPGHTIPPHRINYRANIWGFREIGVRRIIAVNAAGGMAEGLAPGAFVVPDQVIDMTQGARAGTYHDGPDVVHVDFTEPYCPELREVLVLAARERGIALNAGGTYLAVNGPRLESRAEIAYFTRIGADVVGMTGMPEAALARELALCMAMVSVVTNRAAGLSGGRLTTDEVVAVMAESAETLRSLLSAAIAIVPVERSCACGKALSGSRMEAHPPGH